MIRKVTFVEATLFQSTPKAFGVGPTAKMAVLQWPAHSRRLRKTDCQSVRPAELHSAELNEPRIEYPRGAQALKPVFRRLVPAMLLLTGIFISCPAFLFAQSRTVKLNETAFAYAKELIAQGSVVIDKKNAWRDHNPTAEEEKAFIR